MSWTKCPHCGAETQNKICERCHMDTERTTITVENFHEKSIPYFKSIGGNGEKYVYMHCDGLEFDDCSNCIFFDICEDMEEMIPILQKWYDEQEENIEKQDMTLKEAQKIFRRMCTRVGGNRTLCNTCPLWDHDCPEDLSFRNIDVSKFEKALTDWNAAHSPKTNWDVLKEKITAMNAGEFSKNYALVLYKDGKFSGFKRLKRKRLNSKAEEGE
jgi:hypothetical protein